MQNASTFSSLQTDVAATAATIGSGPLDAAYASLRLAVGDDRLLMVLLQGLIPATVFVALCWLFLYIERAGLFKGRRIVPRDSDPTLTRQAIKETLFNQFVSGPLVSFFVIYHLDVWIHPTKYSGPLPSAPYAVGQLLLAFVIEDFLIYWTLHHPRLYRHYHKKHHTFLVTNTFASAFSGGVEAVFSHAFSGLTALWLTKMHLTVAVVYNVVLVLDTVNAHCNYDIPLSPFTSGRRHNYHHSHNIGTFALKFGFWDWLCGTDAAFKAYVKREETKKKQQTKKTTVAAAQ